MKTVVFIANLDTFGGVETVFFYYAEVLSKKYKVKLVSPSYLPENIRRLCCEKNIEYMYRSLKEKWYRHPIKYITYKINKKQYKKKVVKSIEAADIIVDFKNGGGNEFIKKIASLPVKKILWIHGGMPFVEEDMGKINWAVYDKIVCLTDSLKEKMLKKYPELRGKIIRIYNPMDLNKIQKLAEASVEDIKDNRFFAHVSRVDADKDIKTLIDGYDLFYQKTQSATPLYIIGNGLKKKEMEMYAGKKSSAAQIKFLGKKENPFPYMKEAKAVILSSPSEGLSCVLIEALCCSKGVTVSSDCPDGPREILGNGKFGKLFNVGDAVALADILQQIDTGKLSKEMFSAGLNEHLQKFTMKDKEKELSTLFS